MDYEKTGRTSERPAYLFNEYITFYVADHARIWIILEYIDIPIHFVSLVLVKNLHVTRTQQSELSCNIMLNRSTSGKEYDLPVSYHIDIQH